MRERPHDRLQRGHRLTVTRNGDAGHRCLTGLQWRIQRQCKPIAVNLGHRRFGAINGGGRSGNRSEIRLHIFLLTGGDRRYIRKYAVARIGTGGEIEPVFTCFSFGDGVQMMIIRQCRINHQQMDFFRMHHFEIGQRHRRAITDPTQLRQYMHGFPCFKRRGRR